MDSMDSMNCFDGFCIEGSVWARPDSEAGLLWPLRLKARHDGKKGCPARLMVMKKYEKYSTNI